MSYVEIIFSAVLVNNIVLLQFLGICPFLGVSRRLSTAIGMGGAVLFVMTLASLVTYYVNVLLGPELVFLRTLSFILTIASLVQVVELILQKVSPPLYQALGIYLPLITTNCAILGVTLIIIQKEYTIGEALTFAVAASVGFTLALIIFAGLRERLDRAEIPSFMRGTAIGLITAGLLSMAFMAFSAFKITTMITDILALFGT